MTALIYYAIVAAILVALGAITEAVAVKLGYIHPWDMN